MGVRQGWNKFWLLLWKNYLLQKRNLTQTFFEILVPVFFIALLIAIRALVDVNFVDSDTIYENFSPDYLPPNVAFNFSSQQKISIKDGTIKPNDQTDNLLCNFLQNLVIDNKTGKAFANPKDAFPIPDLPSWVVLYSPNTTYLSDIMTSASEKLKTENSSILSCGCPTPEDMLRILTLPGIKIPGFDDFPAIPPRYIFLAGVEFTNTLGALPMRLKMTLRFPGERRFVNDNVSDDDDAKVGSISNWATGWTVPLFQRAGPRLSSENEGGSPGYYEEGFLGLQSAISKGVVEYWKNTSRTKTDINTDLNIVLQRFPYPPYLDDPFLLALSVMFPMFIILSFLYPTINIIKAVTTEKEQQLKEAMKMMGLDNWLHWTAWFTKSLIFLLISIILITVLLSTPIAAPDKTVLPKSDPSLVFVFLLFYVTSTICYAFLISTLFTKANTASMVGSVLCFLTYFPYYIMSQNYTTTSLSAKLASSLLHNTAMAYGTRLFFMFEGTGQGLKWAYLFSGASPSDTLTMGAIMGMLIIDAIIYMLLAIYVEAVYPGDFGVPLPWYFFITRAYWCGEIIPQTYDEENNVNQARNKFYEQEPKLPHGIHVMNLRKEFNSKVAVNNLNLKMYKGQITVLLGHNGAGKTTTMSMLTGMIPPTSGTAIVSDRDIRRDMSGVREELGLCPQHNILFAQLTVKEHLDFFGKLKGLTGTELDNETQRFIVMLELENKSNTLAKALSGGMQRRLSVAIALCGHSKVVLLDEPTSGMDPSARRALWDLLQKEKANRTMVLTTHFMDEADILGDRIAIMSEGNLECIGSPYFLKKQYGGGYNIIIVKNEDCDPTKVTGMLQKHMPNIQPTYNIGSELSYHLDDQYFDSFPDIFQDLESNMSNLRVSSYGVTHTTMEEVFMKVGSDSETNLEEESDSVYQHVNQDDQTRLQVGNHVIRYVTGAKHKSYQFWAMVLKHFIAQVRGWLLYLIAILVTIYVILQAVITDRTNGSSNDLPNLQLSLETYKNGIVVFSSQASSDVISNYTNLIGKVAHVQNVEGSVRDYILKESRKDVGTTSQKVILGTEFSTPDDVTVFFNNQPYHVPPLTLVYIYNAILQTISPDLSIIVENHPLPYTAETKIMLQRMASDLGFTLSMYIALAFTYVMSYFVIFYIHERITNSKLIQLVSGVNIAIFWITSFFMNIIFSFGPIITTIVTLIILNVDGFSSSAELGRLVVVLLSAMVATLPLNYVLSFFFTKPSNGLSKLILIHMFTGILPLIIVMVMQTPGLNLLDTANILDWIFTFFPSYSLATSIKNLYQNYILIKTCLPLVEQCGLVPNPCCREKGQCGSIDCVNWTENYFDWEVPGIGRFITAFFLVAFCLFIVLFMMESKFWEWTMFRRATVAPIPHANQDSDVKLEAEKVSKVNPNNEINLLVKNLSKNYGNFPAVKNLSLMVQKGECFGLLGVNGAGKTTTFKMLTGDLSISSGDVYVRSFSTKNNLSNVHQIIGYCPQFDALLDNFTARETLRIFCLLRGVPRKIIPELSEKLAKDMIFFKHLDKKVSELSGGNKRKLSTAVAMIGDPPVIFLDEPTTGMDPAAKRHLWGVLNRLRDSGRTIILTSHSMEECEALCTRLAIMVNGEFQCLGSSQHLKSKFADGYTLTIKMQSKYTSDMLSTQRVKQFVVNQFPGSQLKEEFEGLITYSLPKTNLTWATMFSIMKSKSDELNIEDYSLGQSSLEQVFLSFTKYQKAEQNPEMKQKEKSSKLGLLIDIFHICHAL